MFDSDDYLTVVRVVGGTPNESLWRWAGEDGLPLTAGRLLGRDTVGNLDVVRD
jgi:hypothetical protein